MEIRGGQDIIKGPFLSCAFFCEKVLQEKDGILSVVRIIDRLGVNVARPNLPSLPPGTPAPSLPEKLPSFLLSLTMLIAFKSGDVRGSYPIRITMLDPLQREASIAKQNALFEGEDRGVNLIVNIGVVIQQDGLYWFNIFFNEEATPRTRVPLRVIYQGAAQTS